MRLPSKIPKKCEVCGKEYWVIPSKADTSKYCSKKCQGIAFQMKSKEEVVCANCGRKFLRGKSFRKNYEKGKQKSIEFCSIECRDIWRHKNTIEKLRRKIEFLELEIKILENRRDSKEGQDGSI